MSEISFYKMADFAREYIAPSVYLPHRYISQISNNEERHFSVFRRSEQACNIEIKANKSEFYKVLLMTKGSGEFDYGLKTYHVKPGSLIFVRPNEVKACRETTEDQDGYYCTFTEKFYSSDISFRPKLKLLTLFAPETHPVIQLTDDQVNIILRIFEKLHFEFNNFNKHSEEIIKLYLRILLLESSRIYPGPVGDSLKRTANLELTQRFNDLLEEQFNNIANAQPIAIKSSSQFANKLSVHSNHLNASVKQVTDKSVSEIISNRIHTEAQILLKYTDKHVAEISYLLGFKEPSSFIHFFKKKNGLSPTGYKNSIGR